MLNPPAYQRFVALGDSFTEGLDDPDGDGEFRGWADRFAELLATQHSGLQYANLAVRGKKIDQVVAEQVPAAVALRPDLVSLAAGVNDVLRPKVDLDVVAGLIRIAVSTLRAAGSDVLLTCVGDPGRRSALFGRLTPRIHAYDQRLRQIAADHDCLLMDFWGVEVFDDDRCWSVDRLHLSPIGHERVARAAADLVGFGDASWRELLPPADSQSWLEHRRGDLEWGVAHLGPWLGRRLQGRSSGDGRAPKRPELARVAGPSTAGAEMSGPKA